MSKPTTEELNIALAEAGKMREQQQDPHFIAKSLLNLNYRIDSLEKVLSAVDQYLHFGEDAHAHANLLHMVEAAKAVEARTRNRDESDNIGLS